MLSAPSDNLSSQGEGAGIILLSKDELKIPALRTLELSFLLESQGLVPISPFQLWLHSTLFHFFNKFPKQLSTLKSLHGFTVQLTGCVLVSFLLCSLMSHTKSDNLNVPISSVVWVCTSAKRSFSH